jgi:hypothetical protein
MPFLSVPFTNTKQQKTYWCWAAVAANVYNSMRPASVALESQCDVAKLVEGPHACDSAEGNLDALSSALADLGINDQLATRPRIVVVENEFEGITNQLNPVTNENGVAEPVCAEIMFPGPAFHFVAISAIDTDNQHVWIADPYLGGNSVEFSFQDFVNNYNYSSSPLPAPGTVQNLQRVVNKWQATSNPEGKHATSNDNPGNAG